jgi:iron complex outermembrane receptor protein
MTNPVGTTRKGQVRHSLIRQLSAAIALTLGSGFAAAQSTRDLADLSLEELSSLTVTSVSRRAEPLSVVASAIQVITADDIRRAGATRIGEALRLAPNLQVAQINGDGFAVSARGFNSSTANKLLVMIDGRTIYSPLFAGVFWEAQDVPLYDVERIEVISGPGGTLWGANAVNGVINIITRPAGESQGLLLRAGAGTELRGDGALRYGGELGDNAHFRVYGQYADRDGAQLANGRDAPNESSLGQGGFRIDWNASAADAVTVQGDANESHTGRATSGDATARSHNILARWTHTLSPSSDVQLQTYYDSADRASPHVYGDQLDTFDAEFQHQFQAGHAQQIVWGLTFRQIEDHFRGPLYSMDPANVTLRRIGGFVQDEIALAADRMHLTVGTKVEDNEYTGTEWQPSVGLAWRFQTGQLLWSRISRAVRTPSRLDADFGVRGRPPFLYGGDNIKSEKLLAYEAGIKLQPARTVSISLATYYNDYDDVRSVERLNPASPVPQVVGNGFEGQSSGAELTVDYKPLPRWRLWGGYTYLDLNLENKPGSTDPTRGAAESHDWDYQLFLRSSLDVAEGWEVDAAVRRIGGIDNQNLPPYTEFDLRVGWHVTSEIELSLTGSNLLHSDHAEFGAAAGRISIERAAYAQITWTPQ